MIKIFISYRREDSADFCGRLHDRLLEELGEENVFRDIQDINPGDEFAKVIAERIAECNVLIAVIGNKWISATDTNGRRRIDDEDDYVRAEIGEALRKDKVIVPVLVQRAGMPQRHELPPDISKLADRNAIEIGDFRSRKISSDCFVP